MNYIVNSYIADPRMEQHPTMEELEQELERKKDYVATLTDHNLILSLIHMTEQTPYLEMTADVRQMWQKLKDEIHHRINR